MYLLRITDKDKSFSMLFLVQNQNYFVKNKATILSIELQLKIFGN